MKVQKVRVFLQEFQRAVTIRVEYDDLMVDAGKGWEVPDTYPQVDWWGIFYDNWEDPDY